jgi:hypothetical protein
MSPPPPLSVVYGVNKAPQWRELPSGGLFFGLNTNQLHNWSGTWTDEAYTSSVAKQLQPGFLRYPGGTNSLYWDWSSGWFADDVDWTKSNIPWLGKLPRRPYTLEHFARGINATGATPVFVLNMLTRQLDHALAGLRNASAAGLRVNGAYVELGNELYESSVDRIERFPTAADYAKEASAWARAIRQAFPSAHVSAVGAYSEHYGGDARHNTWNKGVYASLDTTVVDAVSLHIYQGSGLGSCSSAPGAGVGTWGNATAQLAQFKALRAPGGVERMLAVPRKVLANMSDPRTAPAGLALLVTEWNLIDPCGPVRLTWAHALYVGLMAHGLLAQPRITFATYHALGGNPMFTALFTFNDTLSGLLLPGVVPPPTPSNRPTAPGVVLGSLSRAASGCSRARELTAAEATSANVTGFLFDGDGGVAACAGLWLVNAGGAWVDVLPPAAVGGATGEMVRAGDPTAIVADTTRELEVELLTIPAAGAALRVAPFAVVWAA